MVLRLGRAFSAMMKSFRLKTFLNSMAALKSQSLFPPIFRDHRRVLLTGAGTENKKTAEKAQRSQRDAVVVRM